MGFFAPYKGYLNATIIVVFLYLIIRTGSNLVVNIAQGRTSRDVTFTMRTIFQLVGYGIGLALAVSVLTDNAAAALTIGSFAGLVAGYASQQVMGNLLAGLFIAVSRPIKVDDRVNVTGGGEGTVKQITLMHTILTTETEEILIPSSKVAGAVLKISNTNS